MAQAATFEIAELEFSEAECRAQLDRILGSSDFEVTARERRFLGYVVSETLAGRASRIKAYVIAVEVFGRDVSFDPQIDPIVRIEAGHLRRALERYYFTAGHADPIQITIPKGGYVPTFSPRSITEPVAPPEPIVAAPQAEAARAWPLATWSTVALSALVAALAVLVLGYGMGKVSPTTPDIPRLLVEPFDDLTGSDASAAITRGFTQEIIAQLSKFKDIVVTERMDNSGAPPRFTLSGSVSHSANGFRLQVKFVNRSEGSVLWANSYSGGLKVADVLEAQADVARNVATSLAQVYGVVYQADAARPASTAPDDWAAYSCTLSYYAYRIDLDPSRRADVRACLENAVERFPNYATGWSLLAMVAIDDVRFQFPFDPVSSQAGIDEALAMARRAVALDPLNTRALHAEMSALFFNREYEAGRKVGERALAINPNDTDLKAGFGVRLALSGKWQEGGAMIADALERASGPLAYYEAVLALCAYFQRDSAKAVMLIKNSPVPKNEFYHLIAAAIYGEAGLAADAERERAWLLENAPALLRNVRREIARRLNRAEDVEFFLGGLGKAGLDIPS